MKERRLSLSLLGAFQARVDGSRITGFDYDKVRALLAYLAVERDVSHRRDALAALLWPEQAAKAARHSLSQALFMLRQVVGDRDAKVPFILADHKTIQINEDADIRLDVTAFESELAACAAHDHPRPAACGACMSRRRKAVALYRGDFLQGMSLPDSAAFDDWMAVTRERLHRLAIDALRRLARFHEERGELQQAQQFARREAELEPWREEAHRQLMRLLARSGERSAALAQYERCRQILKAELGVAPAAETTRLYRRIQKADGDPAGHLPTPPTPFIGRREEVANVSGMLVRSDCRLVTLVGPGGIGKTRIALEVAARQADWFLDGVYFVPLATVETETETITAIADALPFSFTGGEESEEALLVDYLRERELLLVLDNLEHLPGGEAILQRLLQQAPGVTILATSRVRTNLRAEWVYPVEGFPVSHQADLATLEAAQLFAESARRVRQSFSLQTMDEEAVARIVRLVEGVPLAIELAASWVRLLPARAIAEKIASGLNFLTTLSPDVPQRHRSMRTVFEQTWRLLTEEEREALCKLSVFRGGFTQAVALEVRAASLPALASLADKSLIRRGGDGRYDMHELLRNYAQEKLASTPDAEIAARDAHAAYYARFLKRRETRLASGERRDAVGDIDREIKNVRSAWRWAVQQARVTDVERCLHALSLFYLFQNRFQEGARAFRSAVAGVGGKRGDDHLLVARLKIRQSIFHLHLAEHERADRLLAESMPVLEAADAPSERALALRALAAVASNRGEFEAAEATLRASLALYRQLGDEHGIATARNRLGAILHQQGDYPAARRHHERSLQQFEMLGDRRGVGEVLHRLGHLAYELGEYEEAQRLYGKRLAIANSLDDRHRAAASLNNLGNVFYALGKYGDAEERYLQALAAWQEVGNRWGTALAYNNLGLIATERETYGDARRRFQDSLALCRAIGDKRGIALALDNLGELAFKQGRLEEAKAYHEESLALFRKIGQSRGIMYALNFLGQVQVALGASQEAGACYREALQLALAREAPPRALDALTGLATILQAEGEAEQAAEILALVVATPTGERATHERAEMLLARAGEPLGDKVFAEAQRRGAEGAWKEMAARLLETATPD